MKLVEILCNEFGFVLLRQRSSHITLHKDHFFVTVPAHIIGVGLLNTILKDAGVSRKDFQTHL